MRHLVLPSFWKLYHELPQTIQDLADKNFALLKSDPHHPSLHFKKVGNQRQYWSARIGSHYRALALDKEDDIVWLWIGSHAEYDKMLL